METDAQLPGWDPQAGRYAWKNQAHVTLYLRSPWGEKQPQKLGQETQPETTSLSLARILQEGLGREGNRAQRALRRDWVFEVTSATHWLGNPWQVISAARTLDNSYKIRVFRLSAF